MLSFQADKTEQTEIEGKVYFLEHLQITCPMRESVRNKHKGVVHKKVDLSSVTYHRTGCTSMSIHTFVLPTGADFRAMNSPYNYC